MSDKEDGLAVNVAEEEEAARWLLKAGEQLVQRLCVIIITIVGSSLFIASVIIITIAITLEDLREKDGACGGSTSATILHGACPVGSFQFDHDVEIYENLHSCCFDVPFPDYDVKIYKNLHLCCIDIPFPNRKKIVLWMALDPLLLL